MKIIEEIRPFGWISPDLGWSVTADIDLTRSMTRSEATDVIRDKLWAAGYPREIQALSLSDSETPKGWMPPIISFRAETGRYARVHVRATCVAECPH